MHCTTFEYTGSALTGKHSARSTVSTTGLCKEYSLVKPASWTSVTPKECRSQAEVVTQGPDQGLSANTTRNQVQTKNNCRAKLQTAIDAGGMPHFPVAWKVFHASLSTSKIMSATATCSGGPLRWRTCRAPAGGERVHVVIQQRG
jgi:hypothetical protein